MKKNRKNKYCMHAYTYTIPITITYRYTVCIVNVQIFNDIN